MAAGIRNNSMVSKNKIAFRYKTKRTYINNFMRYSFMYLYPSISTMTKSLKISQITWWSAAIFLIVLFFMTLFRLVFYYYFKNPAVAFFDNVDAFVLGLRYD